MTPRMDSVDAGLDWFSITTSTDLATGCLKRIGERYLARAVKVHPWRFRGYCGRMSDDVEGLEGGLAYGIDLSKTDPHGLLQSWGMLSRRIEKDAWLLPGFRVTRLDLAATVLFASPFDPIESWIGPVYDRAGVHITHIQNNHDKGATVYVGSPKSDHFGRIYDKGAQLNAGIPPQVLWRWEVVYRRYGAVELSQTLRNHPGEGQRAVWVLSQIDGFFKKHSIPTPTWNRCTLRYPVVRWRTRVSSDDTTLAWLKTQVRPAMLRVSENGAYDQVLEALGIDGGRLMPAAELAELTETAQMDMFDKLQVS